MTAPGEAPGEVLGFTIADHHARGRLVRSGGVVDGILGAHSYPPPVAKLLAEMLALTALLGALLLEEGGQLTLQVHGEGGPVRLLVSDVRDGALRGYAALDLDRRLPLSGEDGELRSFFGDGRLVLTVERPGGERYQGIVPLDAPTLEEAAQRYFTASEQVSTLVRLAARRDADGRWRAGGLLLQQLPEAGDGAAGAFAEVAVLAGSIRDSELLDEGLSGEALLWRLFHQQQVRLFPETALQRGCRCTEEHIRDVLGRFSEAERSGMRNAEGRIAVDCEFCARQFLFDL